MLFAQSDRGITDDSSEVVGDEEQAEDLSREDEESYNMWSDPLYYQFEEMMPKLARSIGRLDSRISTLAVTELDFSASLDREFRKVASAKLYGQLLLENPKLKLIKCNECNMIRSEIRAGILTINRGLTDQKARRNLAEKLGVQGFMTAMIIEQERQLTIVVNVYDAQEGRIVLSDAITGVPVPENTYYNIYLGEMTVPVTVMRSDSTSDEKHSGIVLGLEKSERFAESWLIAANFAIFLDNNTKLDDGHEEFDPRLMFDGTIGWELASLMNNNASFVLKAGIGQFLSEQFNWSVFTKAGIKISIGQMLTFNIYNYTLLSDNKKLKATTDTPTNELNGSITSISFGYQF
ncbi:MAG: hypothetical protein GY866_01695 [Proteobacteria bacterium]|nr:hypothetical protein [Pseudomonadota bacterium]